MADFNALEVIDDKLFVYSNTSNFKDWLANKSLVLSTTVVDGVSFIDKLLVSAFQNNLNPKLLLATCQREQSLITTKAPTPKQLNRAFGAGCTDSGDLTGITGLAKQIDLSAATYKKWFTAAKVPVIMSVDDATKKIDIQNAATYALYKYCPHIGTRLSPQFKKYGFYGNFVLWQIWNTWWPEDFA
jgi:hypothetical protein